MRYLVLFALLLAGCSSADTQPAVADCGGEPWSAISQGKAPCENLGKDQCAFSSDLKLVSVDSAEAHWVCTCGDEIHLYWCKEAATP